MSHLRAVLFGFFSLCLAACGGGGGGGSASPTPSGPPPGSSNPFPSNFSSSVPENGPSEMLRESFTFNAPSDTPPSGLALTGPDATLFQVLFEVTPAAANGDRTVTIIVTRLSSEVGNFENPGDADENNVYEFTVSGTYQGQNISSDITITVTDVLDIAEAVGKPFLASLNERGFGQNFVSIPDITGDGQAEVGIGNASQDPISLDAAYIIPSEAFTADTTPADLSSAAVYLARFLQATGTTIQVTFISAQENADGSVDIAISGEGSNKATVYNIASANRTGGFSGDLDPNTFDATSYILDFAALGTSKATLIPDVNGDGKSDLFVQSATLQSGLIFGDDARLNSETTAAYDIEFLQTITPVSGPTFPPYVAKLIDDIDGDTIADLFLMRQNRTVFVSGAVLREPARTELDIEAMTAPQGFYSEDNTIDVTLYEDFDGDMDPSLVFASFADTGSVGVGLNIIDADDFLALAAQTSPVDLFSAARNFQPFTGQPGLNFVRVLPDVDGDMIDELITFSSSFGQDADVYLGRAMGAVIGSTAAPNVIETLADDDVFSIDIGERNTSSSTNASPPLFLDDSSRLVLGLSCQGVVTADCSGVRLFDSTAIDTAITTDAEGLLLRNEDF